jgi:hypothetical protein
VRAAGRVAVDGEQQQLAGGAADELEVEVDRRERRAAVLGKRLPVVDADERDVVRQPRASLAKASATPRAIPRWTTIRRGCPCALAPRGQRLTLVVGAVNVYINELTVAVREADEPPVPVRGDARKHAAHPNVDLRGDGQRCRWEFRRPRRSAPGPTIPWKTALAGADKRRTGARSPRATVAVRRPDAGQGFLDNVRQPLAAGVGEPAQW